MKIRKTMLKALIRECINEMHGELTEASVLKSFAVFFKKRNGQESKLTVKARDKEEAKQVALSKLRGRSDFWDILFAKQLGEITTTADVAGYDAPLVVKRKKDD